MSEDAPLATDEALFGVLRERTPQAARHRDLLLFRLAGALVATPLGAIEEVTRLPSSMTPIPGTPAALPGILVWRAAVIPIVDLAALATDRPVPADARPRPLLIVPTVQGRVGCIVDELVGTCRVPEAALEPLAGGAPWPDRVAWSSRLQLTPERLGEGVHRPRAVRERCAVPVVDLALTIARVDALVPQQFPGAAPG